MNRNGIFRLRDMIGDECVSGSADGKSWYRAVPMPYAHGIVGRLRAAWAVVMGRAYAVEWPEEGDLERAMQR